MKMLYAILCVVATFAVGSVHARSSQDNVGKPLGELDVKFVENKPDFALTGKPMVVEFWATWCGPCVKGIPHLNELQVKFKDKGLVIVGISDEEKSKIRDFAKETPMNYIVATDEKGKLKKALGVTAIPHAVVVDTSGVITWEGHPANLTAADIEKVLK